MTVHRIQETDPDTNSESHLIDALRRLAITAVHSLRFNAVSVNLRQKDGAFKVVTDVCRGEEITGLVTSGDVWAALLQEEYRVSNSYLIPPAHFRRVARQHPEAHWVIPDIPDATDADDWGPEHMLIVPLRNRKGEMTGFFSVDDPVDGKLPDAQRITDLETFANHAALAQENADLLKELSLKVEHLSALLAISLDISSSLDPERTFESIVSTTVGLLGADIGVLFLMSDDGAHAEVKAATDSYFDRVGVRQCPIGQSVVGEVIQTGRPEVIQAIDEDPRVFPAPIHPGNDAGSLVYTPIVLDGGAVGALGMLYNERYAVPEKAVELMTPIAAQAALAIRNSRLYNDTRRHADRLKVIQAIAARLNRINDPHSIGQAIAQELQELIAYHACRVYVLQGEKLSPIALHREHDEYNDEQFEEFVMDIGQGITGWVAEHGQEVLLDDVGADPRSELIPGTEDFPESMLVVPVKYEERVIGVITLSKLGRRQFTAMDLQVLSTLADQAATAIENANLFARIEAEAEALRQSEERYALVSRATNDAIWDWDMVTDTMTWNPALERIFGYSSDEMDLGPRWWNEHIHPDDRDRVASSLWAVVDSGGHYWSDEYRFRRRNNTYADVIDRSYLVRDKEGRPVRMIGSMMDISERKALEQALAYQAFHDPLTSLPNRALFMDRLEHALARAQRNASLSAVLFIDLDRFKVVNDSLGHDAGDRLLIAVARRLRECLRPEDSIARLSGDEFTVLLEDIENPAEAMGVAQRLTDCLQAPFQLGDRQVYISTSIGIAMGAPGLSNPSELVRHADLAMYRVKNNGRAHYEVFDKAMNTRALERLEVEIDLRRAIDCDQLRLYYQPKVHMASGKIIGVEALVRWQHPERGLILPDDFIPLAEETGLILPLGRWVLQEACLQARLWQDQHGEGAPLVSVNLSARQLGHPDLIKEIAAALTTTGLKPTGLALEITESVLMDDAERNISTLSKLRELGVMIGVDDFGTGYSSLSYLHRFPVAALKIDKSFVFGLGEDTGSTAIVQSVLSLGHALGLSVVAEGVETAEHVAQLRMLGCDLAQGYYFSRPAPACEMSALLEEGIKQVIA